MRVLVTGGTGTLGSSVVSQLEARGYQPVTLSRRPGPGRVVGDVSTGVGLPAAIDGIDAIVHAASDPRKDPEGTDVHGTERLAKSGIPVLYVSIVGVDRHPFKYYQYKLAGEAKLRQNANDWTVLRATQFHSFLDMLLDRSLSLGQKLPGKHPPLLVPKDWRFQPVSHHEVAHRIVELLEQGPTNTIEQFAGPHEHTSQDLAKAWAHTNGGKLITIPSVGKVAAAYKNGGALPIEEVPQGTITWQDFLAGEDLDPVN